MISCKLSTATPSHEIKRKFPWIEVTLALTDTHVGSHVSAGIGSFCRVTKHRLHHGVCQGVEESCVLQAIPSAEAPPSRGQD